MSTRQRSKWLPRLFILSIAPSVAFVIALIFFPESTNCPLLVPTVNDLTRPLPGQPFFEIDGSLFPINNTFVFDSPGIPGNQVVFLGIVVDVSSGPYGQDQGYHVLASGKDSTRALLLSSLDEANLTSDIEDIPKDKVKNTMKKWIPFFLNKYKQLGVMEGPYWTKNGQPTELVQRYIDLVRSESPSGSNPSYQMEECEYRNDREVTCRNSRLVPKLYKKRGNGKCVCVNEDEIFGIQDPNFLIVHFDNCTDRTCTL